MTLSPRAAADYLYNPLQTGEEAVRTIERKRDLRAIASALLLVATSILVSTCTNGSSPRKLPDSTPFPPDVQERIHAIRDRMAAIRQLPVNNKAAEGLISRERLRDFFSRDISDAGTTERRENEAFNIAYRLLHLIGPQDDLVQEFSSSYAEDILGLYVNKEHRLVLVGAGDSLNQQDELTLAHEYIHSFQDHAFDLRKLDSFADKKEGDNPTEYATTARCLVEGDATFGSVLYARETFGPDFFSRPETTTEQAPPDSTPAALKRYINFDYRECTQFVAALYRNAGNAWGGVDRAYRDPPKTTEQILHPDKYLSHEAARKIMRVQLAKRLGQDWEQRDVSVFGEFDVYNYLLTVLGDEDLAKRVAAGWGAGWISVYSQKPVDASAPQNVLVHVETEWDTTPDFLEFIAAFRDVIRKVPNGTFQSGGQDGPVCWQAPGEFGYIAWDQEHQRADIIVTTSNDALNSATSDFLSVQIKRSCPERPAA